MNHTENGFPIWDDAFDAEHFTPKEIAESDRLAKSVVVNVRKDKATMKAKQTGNVKSHKTKS